MNADRTFDFDGTPSVADMTAALVAAFEDEDDDLAAWRISDARVMVATSRELDEFTLTTRVVLSPRSAVSPGETTRSVIRSDTLRSAPRPTGRTKGDDR